MRTRPNYASWIFATIWLLIVLVPLYVMVKAAFQSQDDYGSGGPLGVPSGLTLDNFTYAFQNGFGRYLINSAILTSGSILVILVVVPPLSFAVVRGQGRWTRSVFTMMLFGLAIPAQVVVIPLNYLIIKAGLFDTLLGIILPTAAFMVPITTLILSSSMREITNDLYEAMAIDGASSVRTFLRLVLPLSRGGIATIIVYTALVAWNSYLIPLVLTRSESLRVATTGLGMFKQEHSLNVPGLMAAIILTVIPILLIYIFARRALVRGLMGVGGK